MRLSHPEAGLAGGLDGPAVGGGEFGHHGQADARADRAGGAAAEEPVKDVGEFAGGMPGPVSTTRMMAHGPSVVVSRRTSPPAGVYLRALESRLATIWPMRT